MKFTAVPLSLVLLPVRKRGELSLGEGSDVAPEKPEGNTTARVTFSESHSCVLAFQTSFPLEKKNKTENEPCIKMCTHNIYSQSCSPWLPTNN